MYSGTKRIKYCIRSVLDHFASASGILRYYERHMYSGLTILMYHRVLPMEKCIDYPLKSLVIPEDVFRAQMAYLSSFCRVLPVREALEELNGEFKTEKPLVSVTFDDGYYDNFTIAAPLLEEFGIRGTFFITTGFIESGRPQWYDRAAEAWKSAPQENDISLWMSDLKIMDPEKRMKRLADLESSMIQTADYSEYGPMSIAQITDLDKRGHEIASHTVSHPILTQLKSGEVNTEAQKSSEQLEAWTGEIIKGFCYPNGNYNHNVEYAVKQAGYEYACTVEEGINLRGCDPFRLSRLPVTMQRSMIDDRFDPLGFRAELCRLRSLWRR